MNIIKLIGFLGVVLAIAPVSAEEQRVVFKGGNVVVTYEDMERYLVENTPADPGERADMLGKPGIFRDMAESLYTVRALAEEAASMPDFDKAQAEWTGKIIYQRRIASNYRYKYVEHVLKDVNWEATAKEAYQVEKDSYMTEEQVNASHILITTKSRSDEEAQALASDIRERALKGDAFGELAKEFSEDGSAEHNAGNLGFFKRGQMVKPFEAVVFEMRDANAISEVVKSPFGYHVIQYHGRKEAEQLPFDSVKDEIIEQLKIQMTKKVWQDKIIAVRSAGDIVVDGELLEELQKKHQAKVEAK